MKAYVTSVEATHERGGAMRVAMTLESGEWPPWLAEEIGFTIVHVVPITHGPRCWAHPDCVAGYMTGASPDLGLTCYAESEARARAEWNTATQK